MTDTLDPLDISVGLSVACLGGEATAVWGSALRASGYSYCLELRIKDLRCSSGAGMPLEPVAGRRARGGLGLGGARKLPLRMLHTSIPISGRTTLWVLFLVRILEVP